MGTRKVGRDGAVRRRPGPADHALEHDLQRDPRLAAYVAKASDHKVAMPQDDWNWTFHGRNAVQGDFRFVASPQWRPPRSRCRRALVLRRNVRGADRRRLGGPLADIAGWVLMSTAMMLPTSLPLVTVFRTITRGEPALVALLITGYVGVWGLFGFVSLLCEGVLHEVAHQLPALVTAIPRALLLTARLFQFSPLKSSCLAQCRSPSGLSPSDGVALMFIERAVAWGDWVVRPVGAALALLGSRSSCAGPVQAWC